MSNGNIDVRAVIDPKAQLADDVKVGPFSVIGPDVTIDAGTEVGPHVVIQGPTSIGKRNRFWQFSSIGDAPQDKKYAGEPTRLEIGDDNTVREFCTLNRGTTQDAGVTRIGSRNWIMAYVHIAHDCQIGNDIILANSCQLAGHVHVEDHAILGGMSGSHQFCRVGAHSFLGYSSTINQDVPPFVTVSGNPVRPRGINSEGLKRRGFTAEQIAAIKKAYRILYRSKLKLADARQQLVELAAEQDVVQIMIDFIDGSERGLIR